MAGDSIPTLKTTSSTSLPFRGLPKELRDRIWILALPGPRIVYVERHLEDREFEKIPPSQRPEPEIPYATYFSSPSPSGSVMALSRTCRESRSLILKTYTQIFPGTWFSFSKDYLYLDWGHRVLGTQYWVEDFDFRPSSSYASNKYARPKVLNMDIAKEVRNLVVANGLSSRDLSRNERWVVKEVLPVFTRVEILVLADQMHKNDERIEELTWSFGEVGDEPRTDQSMNSDLSFTNLLLWREGLEYPKSGSVDYQIFRDQWETNFGVNADREMPFLVKKYIITTSLKQRIRNISGLSNDDIRQLEMINWEFVLGEHTYTGRLDLPCQVAYLELVLTRVSLGYSCCTEVEIEVDIIEDIAAFVTRRDALVAELDLRELIVSEAEDWIC